MDSTENNKQENIILLKIHHICMLVKQYSHLENVEKEYWRFGLTADLTWDLDDYTNFIIGIASGFADVGKRSRWAKDPKDTIKLLNERDLYSSNSFFGWYMTDGKEYPNLIGLLYLHEYLRLLCIQYLQIIKEDPLANPIDIKIPIHGTLINRGTPFRIAIGNALPPFEACLGSQYTDIILPASPIAYPSAKIDASRFFPKMRIIRFI